MGQRASRFAVIAVLLLGTIVTASTIKADTPANGLIAYEANREGNWDIYTIYPDGSGLQRLTDDRGFDYNPSWSPDARFLLYESGIVHKSISRMNADGSGKILLSEKGVDSWHPRWSPDGGRIAYIATFRRTASIFIMNADGTDKHRITDGIEVKDLCWSPDGQQIAFIDEHGALYILKCHNNSISKCGVWGDKPSWSPKGEQLLLNGKYNDLLICDLNRNTYQKLPDRIYQGTACRWSPDGGYFACYSLRVLYIYRYEQVVARDVRNHEEIKLSIPWLDGHEGDNLQFKYEIHKKFPVQGGPFAWAPDGTQIVYAHPLPGYKACLSVIDVTTGHERRLTDGKGIDTNPSWAPIPDTR